MARICCLCSRKRSEWGLYISVYGVVYEANNNTTAHLLVTFTPYHRDVGIIMLYRKNAVHTTTIHTLNAYNNARRATSSRVVSFIEWVQWAQRITGTFRHTDRWFSQWYGIAPRCKDIQLRHLNCTDDHKYNIRVARIPFSLSLPAGESSKVACVLFLFFLNALCLFSLSLFCCCRRIVAFLLLMMMRRCDDDGLMKNI